MTRASPLLPSPGQAHPRLPKSACSLNEIASLRVLHQFVLKSPVILVMTSAEMMAVALECSTNTNAESMIRSITFQVPVAVAGGISDAGLASANGTILASYSSRGGKVTCAFLA